LDKLKEAEQKKEMEGWEEEIVGPDHF